KQLGERDDTIKGARADLGKREAALKALQADLAAAKEKAEAALAARDKELEAARERLAAMAKVVSDRQAALAAADLKLARAEKEKHVLMTASESRFAGIELTGERVVFLVDTSGSMEQLDENTASPQKWEEVRQTVARVMRSLPKLEKFQLIAFGPKHDYPLGSAGKWLDMDPKSSPELVLKTLAAIKPRGGTNMYVALDEAFRYRPQGLDTIYLLSDGLPNQGEGLTPTQKATLKDIERGVALGKHVRSTLKYTWNKPVAGQRVKIHTIGFFYESPDLGSFLWALARENDGSFVGMSRP
ncbi:MAG: vWA domain-containing protein, partial [Gemmataceae bacterium]